MDTTHAQKFGAVELVDALRVLLKNEHALDRLRKHLGPNLFAEVEKLPIGSIPQGRLWEQIHDFFSDEIWNESESVWSGTLLDPEDEGNPDSTFPISIREYGGVFYIWALEFDPMGYFLSRSDAEGYMYFNWDNVRSD